MMRTLTKAEQLAQEMLFPKEHVPIDIEQGKIFSVKYCEVVKLAQDALEQAGAWQDISTAPKDGTEIIGYCAKWNKKSEIIYWPVHSQYTDWTDGVCVFDGVYNSDGDVFHKPTHWQPLPPAPTGEAK